MAFRSWKYSAEGAPLGAVLGAPLVRATNGAGEREACNTQVGGVVIEIQRSADLLHQPVFQHHELARPDVDIDAFDDLGCAETLRQSRQSDISHTLIRRFGNAGNLQPAVWSNRDRFGVDDIACEPVLAAIGKARDAQTIGRFNDAGGIAAAWLGTAKEPARPRPAASCADRWRWGDRYAGSAPVRRRSIRCQTDATACRHGHANYPISIDFPAL